MARAMRLRSDRAVVAGITAALGLLALLGTTGCARTPCDPIGRRASVITAQEYQACASEMMTTLDALSPQVSKFVRGDASMRPSALESARHLQLLLSRTGVERDMVSPGRTVERWPDSRLREFNSAVFQAAFSYHTALEVGPNVPAGYRWDYLEQGWKHHDNARSAYHQVW